MNIATVFPTCNTERATTARDRWRRQGYLVGVWVEEKFVNFEADLMLRAESYPGYWQAANCLIRAAAAAGADIVVPIGDDMDPDPNLTAKEIGARYQQRFPDGFGVMQPTGDPLDGTDRICGSPWLGRGWIQRAYGGAGALWPEYGHFYGDEELQAVATRLGVLWQCKEITQYHHHWVGRRSDMQAYQKANSDRWWHHDAAIFNRRKAADFPCSTPLPKFR